MLLVPHSAFAGIQDNFAGTPSSTTPGTLVTAHATIHTKGNYSELFSATTLDTHLLSLMMVNTATAATATDMLLDIAIGPAASEQPIISNLLVGWSANTAGTYKELHLPIYIPRGTRVSARCQALISADTIHVAAMLYQGASRPPWGLYTACDAIGVSTAASRGTGHTAGNTGAYSSYANIGSTTARNYKAIFAMFSPTSTATGALIFHFDLGIGSATLARWYVTKTSGEDARYFPSFPFLCDIPEGTQLQTRGECSGTAESIDLAFYGMY